MDSPPSSPASILKAQLIIEKAKLANSKVKKREEELNNPGFDTAHQEGRSGKVQEGSQEGEI